MIESGNGRPKRRQSSKDKQMHTSKTLVQIIYQADQVVFIRILQTERFVVSISFFSVILAMMSFCMQHTHENPSTTTNSIEQKSSKYFLLK